jgi:hypothetical protein
MLKERRMFRIRLSYSRIALSFFRYSLLCQTAFALITILATIAPKLTWAENGPLSVELNKLEPHDKGCRVYILIGNPNETRFQSLKLDLIFFRPDGVIDRRLAIDVAPVYPNKKTVKTFDLDSITCEAIGTILLNEVMDCRGDNGPIVDCLARLALSSRASARFEK